MPPYALQRGSAVLNLPGLVLACKSIAILNGSLRVMQLHLWGFMSELIAARPKA